MSRNHPLSYPAPRPEKRTFNPLKAIPKMPEARHLFDVFFCSNFMRGWFKKISLHGLFPLILGTILALTGTKAMPIKSIAVLICALWLSLDIGVWIAEQKWSKHLKTTTFSISFCLCFCVAMLTMYSFLAQVLDEQQDDVLYGLEAKIDLPPSKVNLDSTFTIKNNSHNEIGSHALFCGIISGIAPHTQIKNSGVSFVSGSDQPMGPGGDAESQSCINGAAFTFLSGPDKILSCMDVIVGIRYSLTSQPDLVKEKRFRYVSEVGRDFQWYPALISAKQSVCDTERFKPH